MRIPRFAIARSDRALRISRLEFAIDFMGSNIAQYAREPTARGFISRDVRARASDVKTTGRDARRRIGSRARPTVSLSTREASDDAYNARPRSNAIERDRTKDARGDDADADAAGDAHGCG